MILASFASSGYERLAQQLHKCCATFDVPYRQYDEAWLKSTPEYEAHKDLFSCKRGHGFWAWKPLIILDALKYDDTVVYCDSSVVFNTDPHDIVSSIMTFGVYMTSFMNYNYCKRDAYVYMNCDEYKYYHGSQVWAGAIVFNKRMLHVLEEWKTYCLDRRIISDDPNTCGLPNLPVFKDHRHDQSILSLLAIKYASVIQYLNPCFRDY